MEKIKRRLEAWGIDWREDGPPGTSGEDGKRIRAARVGEEFTLKFLKKWMTQVEIPTAGGRSSEAFRGPVTEESDDESEDSGERRARKHESSSGSSKLGQPGTDPVVSSSGTGSGDSPKGASTGGGGHITQTDSIGGAGFNILQFDSSSQDFSVPQGRTTRHFALGVPQYDASPPLSFLQSQSHKELQIMAMRQVEPFYLSSHSR